MRFLKDGLRPGEARQRDCKSQAGTPRGRHDRRPRPRRCAHQHAGDGGAAASAASYAGSDVDGFRLRASARQGPGARVTRFPRVGASPGAFFDALRSRDGARLHDAARWPGHDQPHIRSPPGTAAPISRVRRAGLGGGDTLLVNGPVVRPRTGTARPPGPIRADQARAGIRRINGDGRLRGCSASWRHPRSSRPM
jgi:hypothetical protein